MLPTSNNNANNRDMREIPASPPIQNSQVIRSISDDADESPVGVLPISAGPSNRPLNTDDFWDEFELIEISSGTAETSPASQAGSSSTPRMVATAITNAAWNSISWGVNAGNDYLVSPITAGVSKVYGKIPQIISRPTPLAHELLLLNQKELMSMTDTGLQAMIEDFSKRNDITRNEAIAWLQQLAGKNVSLPKDLKRMFADATMQQQKEVLKFLISFECYKRCVDKKLNAGNDNNSHIERMTKPEIDALRTSLINAMLALTTSAEADPQFFSLLKSVGIPWGLFGNMQFASDTLFLSTDDENNSNQESGPGTRAIGFKTEAESEESRNNPLANRLEKKGYISNGLFYYKWELTGTVAHKRSLLMSYALLDKKQNVHESDFALIIDFDRAKELGFKSPEEFIDALITTVNGKEKPILPENVNEFLMAFTKELTQKHFSALQTIADE